MHERTYYGAERQRNKGMVVCKNRYGLDITGELYHSKDPDMTQKHPALIVGAPYGGAKEQGPCVYGNELAQRALWSSLSTRASWASPAALPPPV